MCRIFITLISMLLTLTAWADRGGFRYTYWSVRATIAADATWAIEESEQVHFYEPRHGIYRYIPAAYYTALNTAPDGQPEQRPSRRYCIDFEVQNTWGAESEVWYDDNGNWVIRFGSEDFEVEGDQIYGADYTYRYHDDRIEARDFIYHTLKPADIAEPVDTFSFELHFDKPLPADIAQRLQLFTGQWGDNHPADHVSDLQVTPTLISGKLCDLQPGQAVTLYAELPAGYWVDPVMTSSTPALVFTWLAIILALVLLYVELFRRQPEPSTSVEFYAPDDITPSEVGKIIDDQTDIIDLTALVPWLAERGYLRITELPGGHIELHRLRQLPADAPAYQQRIVEMLFPTGADTQRIDQLGEHPTLVETATKALDAHFSGDRRLISPHFTWLIWVLCGVSTLAMCCNSRVEAFHFETLIVGLFGWGLTYLSAIAIRLFNSPKDAFRTQRLTRILFGMRWVCFAVGLVGLMFFFSDWADLPIPMPLLLVMVGLCFITCELSGRLMQDTPYRRSLKGRLRGFREFIETAERDRLQQLVDRDPSYFYKVLPYAMLFDLSDKWVQQFTTIGVKPVDWYRTQGDFSSSTYISGLTSHLSSTVHHAITTSSYDSSSSGSGGGFSGGGGGGGGGGSW